MRLSCLVLLFVSILSAADKPPQKYIMGVPLDPEPTEEDELEPQEAGPPFTVSLLGTTPVLNTNSFEQMFSTWMPQIILGYPLGGFHLETGVRISISRLNFGTVGSDFNHYFVDLPLRLLAPMIRTEKTEIALVLGFIVRILEYDTRTTADGGWGRTNASANLLGEFGIAIRYHLGRVVSFRIDLSTAQMGGGVDFAF
ncbi:MAG: hypothetical protein HYR96_06995 [Deltaproteobacteria bacterium]|nr:hypothetical protein [Deltaproteobacteria bacterium]MBI3295352.1 hypothetical protein [Deltaproteobacteria bacterium]